MKEWIGNAKRRSMGKQQKGFPLQGSARCRENREKERDSKDQYLKGLIT